MSLSTLTYVPSDSIALTESAIKKIRDLAVSENDPSAVLRISVSGGGCSGFQYNFKLESSHANPAEEDDDVDLEDEDEEFFEEDDEEDDEDEEEVDLAVLDKDNRPILLIDRRSSKFLHGAVLDYVQDLTSSSFVVSNPMAKSGCGCGNSFAV